MNPSLRKHEELFVASVIAIERVGEHVAATQETRGWFSSNPADLY